MDTIAASLPASAAQRALASAVPHEIERMSKEEVQTLVRKATVELHDENAALKKRIEQLEAAEAEQRQSIEKLEADKVRLFYQIGRLSFDPEEWERTFDPNEYTVSAAEMLAAVREIMD